MRVRKQQAFNERLEKEEREKRKKGRATRKETGLNEEAKSDGGDRTPSLSGDASSGISNVGTPEGKQEDGEKEAELDLDDPLNPLRPLSEFEKGMAYDMHLNEHHIKQENLTIDAMARSKLLR